MSQEQPQPTLDEATAPGEPSAMSERTAQAALLLVALGAVWGIVAAWPEVAYVIVGILATCGWQKVRSWTRGRRASDTFEVQAAGEPAAETVTQTLHRLAAPHVFLADFAAARGLSKDAARAVLEALGITVRRAVRNGSRTGVGVHKDDLPPLPRPSQKGPDSGVDQGQPTNQQSGVRIERTDGGMIIYDLTETRRHQRVQP